jgi:CubicO group peptidase (beta-lactamase class C family)
MTQRGTRLLAGLVIATSLVAASASPALAQRKPAAELAPVASVEAVGFSSERLKKLDAAMAKVVADGEVAGMTTYLARHGKLVAFNTYGEAAPGRPMSKDAIVRIYSMTKPITGVAMMILFEEGKWRLDDPVTRYIPEFKDLKVMTGTDAQGRPILEEPKSPITLRQVMSHTAGFGYGLGDEHYVDQQFRASGVLRANGLQEMVGKISTIPLMYHPGEKWSYSAAVDIQGYLVEKLSGQSFGEFLQERIFTPLKMTDTAFYAPPQKAGRLAAVYTFDRASGKLIEATQGPGGGRMQDFTRPPGLESGGGGLVSTTSDYARFSQMILNGGELDGARILSPASVELMGTNVIPERALVTSDGGGGTGARFNEHVGFGLDFMVVTDPRKAGSMEGEGTLSWGGAAGTWFWIDPANDLFFVGMIQRMGARPNLTPLGALSRTLVYQALVEPEK